MTTSSDRKRSIRKIDTEVSRLVAALELCVAELDAYETIRDPMHPQNVALDAGYGALGVPKHRQRRFNR